jgi:raffinose/stachyose/melibiose transport system permease protein
VNLKRVYPYWMTIIPFGIYLIFLIIPSTVGFSMAFTNWSPYVDTIRFTGFNAFSEMFSERVFSTAAVNTLIFGVSTTALKVGLGLVLALALNSAIRSRNLLRTIYFYPAVLSPLVVGLLFSALFDAKNGLVNGMLANWGIDPVSWFGKRGTANFVFIFAEVWRSTGYSMAIILAALQVIPAEYYEAAMMDGARPWTKFRSITLPFLMPAINLVLLTSMLFGLKIFDLVYIMTGGGPGYQTETISTLILNQYGQDMYAQSTATNLAFTLALVLFALAFQRYQKRTEAEL